MRLERWCKREDFRRQTDFAGAGGEEIKNSKLKIKNAEFLNHE
jgi:hypothetical protein